MKPTVDGTHQGDEDKVPISPLQERLQAARQKASEDRLQLLDDGVGSPVQGAAPEQQLSPVQQRLQEARKHAAAERAAISETDKSAGSGENPVVVRPSGRCGACVVS